MGQIKLKVQVCLCEGLAIDLRILLVVFMVLVHKVSGVGCLSVGTKNHINHSCLVSLGETS